MPVCVKLLTTLDGGVLFVNREIALLMKPIADLVLGSERGEVIQVTVPVTKQALKMVVHWLEMKVSNGELRWRLKDLPPEVLLKKEQYYQIAFTSSSTSSSSSSSLASSTSTSIVDEDPAFLRRLNDGTLFHLFTAATALQVGRLAELIITHHATSLLEYNKVDQIRQRFHLFEEVGDHFGFGSPEARANVEAEVLWAAPKGFFLPSPKPIVKTESDEIKKKEEEEKSMDTGESDIQIVWNINDLLPDAYLLQVFSEMTLHSRMALRAVCGRWNALIISQCASILSSNGGGLFIHLYDKKVEQEAAMCSQSEDDKDKEKKCVETVVVLKMVTDEDDTKELKNSKNSKNFKILKNYKVSKTLQNFKYPKEKKKEEEENEEPDFYQQFLATSLPENCPDSCDGSGYSVNESRGADNRPKNLFYMDDIERECCSLPRRSPAFSIERLLEIDLSTVKQEAFQISGFSNCLRSCFESNRATLQPQQQQQLEEGANNNNNSVTIFCPKLPYLESMPKLDYLLAAIVHGLPSLTTFTLWLQKYWEMGNGPVELPFLLNALNGHRQLRKLSMNASLSTAFQHEEDLWQRVDISPVVGRLEKANLGLPLVPLLRGTFFTKGGISSQLKSLKINCNYQRVFSRHRQDEREHLKGHLADNRITDLGLANFLAADELWHVAKLFPHVQKLTLLIPVSLMKKYPDLSVLDTMPSLTELHIITTEFDRTFNFQPNSDPNNSHHCTLSRIKKLSIVSSVNSKCVTNFLYAFYCFDEQTGRWDQFDCPVFTAYLRGALPSLEHLFIFGGVTNHQVVKEELQRELQRQYSPREVTCTLLFHEMKYRQIVHQVSPVRRKRGRAVFGKRGRKRRRRGRK